MSQAIRTLKIEFCPHKQQKQLLDGMLRAAIRIYNQLVEHLHYKRSEAKKQRDLDPESKPYEDPYLNLLQKGWAQDLTRTFINPRSHHNKPSPIAIPLHQSLLGMP